MKRHLIYLGIIAALLLWIFMQDSCEGKTEPVKVEIPAKQGSFSESKPDTQKVIKEKTVVKWRDRILISEAKVDTALIVSYWKATAEQKDSLYQSAVTFHSFRKDFEDNDVKISLTGTTKGTLEGIAADWEVKPRKVDFNCPEVRYRILAGAEVGASTRVDKATAKANLSIQNQKGKIYRIGYDADRTVFVGIDIPIYTRKK